MTTIAADIGISVSMFSSRQYLADSTLRKELSITGVYAYERESVPRAENAMLIHRATRILGVEVQP